MENFDDVFELLGLLTQLLGLLTIGAACNDWCCCMTYINNIYTATTTNS